MKEIKELKRTNKYRLYPNAGQKALLDRLFNGTRFVHNQLLGLVKESKFGTYVVKKGKNKGKEYPKIPSRFALIKYITKLKKEKKFLYEIPNDFLQAEATNLSVGFVNFYTTHGYPKFKTKKDKTKSLNSYDGNVCKRAIKENHVQLASPRLKYRKYPKELYSIKFKKHKTKWSIGKITGYTIKKDNLNNYWVCIAHKFNQKIRKPRNGQVGIDLGIKELITTSDGDQVANLKFLKQSQYKLKRAQQSLSRKKRGSQNRKKQVIRVAKVYAKITNQRNHHNHVVSHRIANENGLVVMESLKIKNMIKNRKLSKAISDVAWGDLTQKIKYKVDENQGTFVQIGQFFPSSKKCSKCGNVKEKLGLDERTYICSQCGLSLDRDVNAALNILHQGRIQLTGSTEEPPGTSIKRKPMESKSDLGLYKYKCKQGRGIRKKRKKLLKRRIVI